VNFMTTETLRLSAGAFRLRFIGLWERALRLSRRSPRRLRLCESLPLGERRFVAVIEIDGARFLLGGTPSSLVLLSRLTDSGGQENEAEARSEARPEYRSEYSSEDKSEARPWGAASMAARKRRRETC
jgi:flagellar biogenesis protein FliO